MQKSEILTVRPPTGVGGYINKLSGRKIEIYICTMESTAAVNHERLVMTLLEAKKYHERSENDNATCLEVSLNIFISMFSTFR